MTILKPHILLFLTSYNSRIAVLSGITSVKIPEVSVGSTQAASRAVRLGKKLSAGVTLGIRGDAFACLGLNANCECRYSAYGGFFLRDAKAITEAA